MPELPEVQTVVDTLRPLIEGRAIDAVHLHRHDILTPAGFDLSAHLRGRILRSIQRRGKRIIFTLDNGRRFVIHLGMTGSIVVHVAGAIAEPHTHLALDFGRWQMRFVDPRRFGGVWWLGKNPADADLGPEPLQMSPRQLAQQLSRTGRPIKSALLDQSLIAGLGNIYVDESLHAAGIHPATAANRLTPIQVRKLSRGIKTVLRRALRHKGSTLRNYRDANGNAGAYQKLHRVYRRTGLPCLACKSPIQRIVLGGRSTHFCPKCQRRKDKG